jgi:hypothetical protein
MEGLEDLFGLSADDEIAENYFELDDIDGNVLGPEPIDGVVVASSANGRDAADSNDRNVADLENLFGLDVEEKPVIPEGVRWMSSAWQKFASNKRWASASKKPAALESKYDALATCWNLVPLRSGDMVQTSETEAATMSSHPNTYALPAAIRDAFRQIGSGVRSVAGQVSIDSSRKMLSNLGTVASLAQRAFARGSRKVFDLLCNRALNAESVVYSRGSDATPMLLNFGSMQSELVTCARYLKWIEAGEGQQYGRWTTITYEQYLRENPGKGATQFGIVELLGITGEVHWGGFSRDGVMSSAVRESFWRKKHEFLFPPQILQKNNSSTLNSSLAIMSAPFDNDGIIEIAKKIGERSDGVVLAVDSLDNCRVTKRFQRATACKYEPYDNILYSAETGCEAHILHNIITSEMKEDKIVGNAHAFAHVMRVHDRKQQLLKAAFAIVEHELVCEVGDPPADCDVVMNQVVQHTFSRQARIVRGCIAVDGCEVDEASCKALEAAMPGFRRMVNGRLVRARCTHYCKGCCVDPSTGETTRATQVRNFFAALVSVGLFGGVNLSTPAKSRWLSTSVVLSIILAGHLVHNILQRAWQSAFGGTWSIPAGMENNDYHKMIKSCSLT